MPAQHHERSQHGCWTCRLRKKKCDERVQACQACELRGIVCHGYGPKPGWMDGGPREKQVLTELQQTIKENLKRKRSYNPIPPRLGSVAASGAAPTSTHNVQPTVEPPTLPITPQSSIHGASPPGFPMIPYGSIVSAYDDLLFSSSMPSNGDGSNALPHYVYETTEEDSNTTLLMHFIDRIFPLQYSCYNPPVLELGRAWLLRLLTRTKPLYHTTLALSGLVMYLSLLKSGRARCIEGYLNETRRQHTLALRELQMQVAALRDGALNPLKGTIDTVACITQLVVFEVLRGGTDSWQIHLQAASTLMPTIAEHISSSGLAINGRPSLTEYKAASKDMTLDFPPHPDDIACDFLVSTLIWYDIIACASTRGKPYLEYSYGYITTNELSNIMGCESWAMILIYRISELQRWKLTQDPCLIDMNSLVSQGSELERLLKEGLERNQGELGGPLSRLGAAGGRNELKPPLRTILLITRIFALSATTYLHTVISGPDPTEPQIKKSVNETIESFKELTDLSLMRNLVWPFCVTACMATGLSYASITHETEGGVENFFSELLKDEKIEGYSGNLAKAWEIVLECWKLREEGRNVDWVDGMKSLGYQVLLV